jgi:hypothetical protein
VYQFDAVNDFFKDRGIPEENLRRLRNAQKKKQEHLKQHAKNAEEIRGNTKSPAELLAEKFTAQTVPFIEEDSREVAGGEPLAVINRRLRLPTDPD